MLQTLLATARPREDEDADRDLYEMLAVAHVLGLYAAEGRRKMTDLAVQALAFIFERMESLDEDVLAPVKSTHADWVRRCLGFLPEQYQDPLYKAL